MNIKNKTNRMTIVEIGQIIFRSAAITSAQESTTTETQSDSANARAGLAYLVPAALGRAKLIDDMSCSPQELTTTETCHVRPRS